MVIESYGKSFMAGPHPDQNWLNFLNLLKKKTEDLVSSATSAWLN